MKPIKLASSIKTLPHSPTLWANDLVHARRARGETVYHMGFGESPFPVPRRMQEALAAAAKRKEYLPADGLPSLIEKVKGYYTPLLGEEAVGAADVLIAPGSKLILYALQMAVEGDLIMPVPSWVSYAPQAMMLNTDIIKVPVRLDDEGYHLSPDILQGVIQKARAEGKNPSKIILNYPNNPTGLTIPEDELPGIAEVCRREGILIISDEIYGQVSFDGNYKSIARYAPDITAVTSGLSKHLSLGGWRLGTGFVPAGVPGLHEALCRITSETWSCVPAPIQEAAISAYENHDDIETHIRDCTAIHKLVNQTISQGLKDLGVTCAMAQGAFYNYPDFDPKRADLARLGVHTSQDLHKYLLAHYNLATLPGEAFGADLEVLTLRLSGCDYDGAAALAAYQAGEALDHAFVEKYAPRIIQSLEIFEAFLETAKSREKAVA